jgi:hypothetical protein
LQLRTTVPESSGSDGIPPPSTEPELNVTDRESIFDPAGNEALLSEAEAPKVEMPPVSDPLPAAAPSPPSIGEPVFLVPAPAQPPLPDAPVVPETEELVFRTGVETVSPADSGPAATEISKEQLLAASPRHLATRRRGGLFLVLIVIPLISYSILATLAIVILYMRLQASPSPFEYLSDLQGDFKGATHEKQGTISYERLQPDSPLPAKLQLDLGQSITLGDVEVTPLKVELRSIKIFSAGLPPVEPDEPALALYLRLKNISQDCRFCPTDPYFERRWKAEGRSGSKPYTFLEMGDERFYGGPLAWQSGRQADESETVEGQRHRVLDPGETVTTFVCTDPEDRMVARLAGYQGELLWRVQVRRGLVREGDREAPATAVIGVRFAPADIRKSS